MNYTKAYEQFGRWCANEVRDPWMNDLDGCKVQDKLTKLGILVVEAYDPAKHGRHELEPGDEIYLFAPGALPFGN